MSNPARLSRVLLAAEAQQEAFATSWPEYRKINRDQSGWVSTIQVHPKNQSRIDWWTRTFDEDMEGPDQELILARQARVANVLVPYVKIVHKRRMRQMAA